MRKFKQDGQGIQDNLKLETLDFDFILFYPVHPVKNLCSSVVSLVVSFSLSLCALGG